MTRTIKRVEEDARVVLRVLRRQELERDRDHERAEDDAAQTPEPAEDDDRVDRDEDRDVEVRRRSPRSAGSAKMQPVKPAIPAPMANARSLSRFTGMPDRTGREGVLAKRAQRTSGARLAEEVEPREDEHRRDEQHVVLLRPGRGLEAEEAQRVDVGDPVRPAGQARRRRRSGSARSRTRRRPARRRASRSPGSRRAGAGRGCRGGGRATPWSRRRAASVTIAGQWIP